MSAWRSPPHKQVVWLVDWNDAIKQRYQTAIHGGKFNSRDAKQIILLYRWTYLALLIGSPQLIAVLSNHCRLF